MSSAAAANMTSRKGISRPIPDSVKSGSYRSNDPTPRLCSHQWLPVSLLDADQVSYMAHRSRSQGVHVGHRGGGGWPAGLHRISYGHRRAPHVYEWRPWWYLTGLYHCKPFPPHVWPEHVHLLEPYASRMDMKRREHNPYDINPMYPTTRGPRYQTRILPLSSPTYHGLR